MNIESKRYKMRATGFGSVEIRDKKFNRSAYVSQDDLPSLGDLAVMSESEFDKVCGEFI